MNSYYSVDDGSSIAEGIENDKSKHPHYGYNVWKEVFPFKAANKMALQLKGLAVKPDDLNSIPRTHMRGKKREPMGQAVLWLPLVGLYVCTYVRTHTHTNLKPKKHNGLFTIPG